MTDSGLILLADMYGCPNRCRHCWLGHMDNRKMEDGADSFIVDLFKPYFNKITFYSWTREPDYCDDYRERWYKDNAVSVNSKPERFELASFWRLVRDDNYVKFLKELGVDKVQLTFFGTEEMTDKYIGRRNAYNELLKATDILIDNGISPRWQAFINEENKNEIAALLNVIEEGKYKARCENFEFFVHEGSCDGENRKLYDIRIEKQNVPVELIPYYLGWQKIYTEREACEILREEEEAYVPHNDDDIVIYVSNRFDLYFNFTNMAPEWVIGNLKRDNIEELVRRIVSEDTFALNMARSVSIKELVKRYGNYNSEKVFSLGDYKMYFLNRYLEDMSR